MGKDVLEEDISPPFKRLRLYAVGVYDSLGLEPYYDSGEQAAKYPDLAICVSDAGAPIAQGPSAGALSPWRVKRLANIMSEQARTLRVRSFIKYLESTNDPLGAHVYLGTKVTGGDVKAWESAKALPTNL